MAISHNSSLWPEQLVEPMETMDDDDISVESTESQADAIRKDLISNISVPQPRRKRVMDV